MPTCAGGFLSLGQIRHTLHSYHSPLLNILWNTWQKTKAIILQIVELLNADIMSFVLTTQKHWQFIVFQLHWKVKHAPSFNMLLRSKGNMLFVNVTNHMKKKIWVKLIHKESIKSAGDIPTVSVLSPPHSSFQGNSDVVKKAQGCKKWYSHYKKQYGSSSKS